MKEWESDVNSILKEFRKDFPFLINVKDVDLVEHIKTFKAQLYDAEKWVENLQKFISAYETELMFRPINKRIHYFDNGNRYKIDEEKTK